MKVDVFILLGICFTSFTLVCARKKTEIYKEPVPEIIGFDLNVTLTAILSRPFKNTVVSPLAARSALCKLAAAARGNARQELLSALALTEDTLGSCIEILTEYLAMASANGVMMINKLYVPYSGDVEPSFVTNQTLQYNIHVEKVDFDKSPLTVRNYINKWIDSNTFSRIRDIVDESDVTVHTSILAINAINFKSTWHPAFDLRETKPRLFSGKTLKKLPFMEKWDYFLYYYDKVFLFKLVLLPMMSRDGFLVLILPDRKELVMPLAAQLQVNPEVLHNARKKAEPTGIVLALPVFNLRCTVDLTDVLKETGIQSIFNSTQSGLSSVLRSHRDVDSLFLSKVKQELFLEFDEFGARRNPDRLLEAKWATEQSKQTFVTPPEVQFIADRPFLFTYYFTLDQDFDYKLLGGVYFGPDAN